jgi:hypothetical protein
VFNNSLPVSSLFCKILLLSLPHCLPASAAHSVLLPFVLCVPFPFNAPFVFLSISAVAPHLYFFTHPLLHLCNNHFITSLCRVLIASVHLVHAICTMLLHLFTMSALSDHHYDFSASLAVFPCVQHHWMSC